MALVTLQTIFQDAFPAYEQCHALPAHVRRAAHALMQCRTAALGLEIRAWGTGAMPACVVPDTGDVTVGARLDMTAQGGRPAPAEGRRGAAHVGRQGMALLIGGKGVWEDRLERDERHRGLRTRGRRRASGGFLQYHANYPRDKRLVQRDIC